VVHGVTSIPRILSPIRAARKPVWRNQDDRTEEEALENIRDAIREYLSVAAELTTCADIEQAGCE